MGLQIFTHSQYGDGFWCISLLSLDGNHRIWKHSHIHDKKKYGSVETSHLSISTSHLIIFTTAQRVSEAVRQLCTAGSSLCRSGRSDLPVSPARENLRRWFRLVDEWIFRIWLEWWVILLDKKPCVNPEIQLVDVFFGEEIRDNQRICGEKHRCRRDAKSHQGSDPVLWSHHHGVGHWGFSQLFFEILTVLRMIWDDLWLDFNVFLAHHISSWLILISWICC